ncbi:MAG: arginase [Thermodesulfobacteriota bacterium]
MRKCIRIIGVPMDLGQAQRGVDVGPSAIRYAGLAHRLGHLGYEISDAGNIEVPVRNALQHDHLVPAIHQACEAAYSAGRIAVEAGCHPVFLGGDHAISIGTVGGVTHGEKAGVIWIDAHGDFNTAETSSTGNIHGMALAHLTGRGLKKLVDVGRPGPKVSDKDIALIGVRDLDEKEREILKGSGIHIFTMRDIDEQGISRIAHEALKRLKHRKRIHVSLDMDSLDPMEATGVGTPVPGGLTYREAHLLMEIIADSRRLCSLDIVEINPIIDSRNKTAKIAVDLAVSLFGKSIL